MPTLATMSVEVRVAGLGGPLCVVATGSEWTVRDAKAAIEAKTGVPWQEQRLLLPAATAELDDAERLGVALGGREAPADLALLRRPPEQLEWVSRVEEDWWALIGAPAWVQRDLDIALAAVRQSGEALEFVAEELRSDPRVVLAAVRQSGCALRFASQELQADPKVVLAAARSDTASLEFAAPELWGDRAFVLGAVRLNGMLLQFAAEKIQTDHEVLLAAIRHSASAFKIAMPNLHGDRDFVIAAVRRNGLVLQYMANWIRADREIVLAAVLEGGAAVLGFAAPALRVDPEIASAAAQWQGSGGRGA